MDADCARDPHVPQLDAHHPVTDPARTEGLGARVVRGVAWKVVSQVVNQGSRVVVAIILARLLTPGDYGLAGMIIVFSNLVLVLTDIGLGSALVRMKRVSEADLATLFWASFALGAVLTLGGIAASGPIAAFFGEPQLKALFAALSLSFVVTALGTTQRTFLTREMDFRSLELRQMGSSLVAAAIALVLAAEGHGPWAIIGQQIAFAIVSTALLWRLTPWRPAWTFSLKSLRALSGFGMNVFGTHMLWYANRNVSQVLIGRFLGAAPLGAYALAYNVMLAPLSRVVAPVRDVLFPAFSRLQDDPKHLGAAWLRVNRLLAALVLPSMVGVMILAEEFVYAVVGARWRDAIPVIQILAWVGLLQAMQQLNSSVLQARDRTGALLRFAILSSVLQLGAFAVGLQWGIVGVAACYAAVNTFLQPHYTALTARSVGLSLGACIRSTVGVVQATLLMGAVVLVAKLLLIDQGLSAAARFPVLVALGIVVYLPACARRAPEVVHELRRVRRRRAPSQPVLEAQPS
jgi:O-antigen/teichoic acid export membrane protein